MKSRLNRIFSSLLFLMMITSFLVLPVGNLFAQDAAAPLNQPATKTAVKGTKRTNVDFEDQLIQGEVKKPELFYLLQKKQFNFGKLIKLRENFIPEMTKTAEDVGKTK